MIDKEYFKQRVLQKYEENINNTSNDFYNIHFYTKKTKEKNLLKKTTVSNIIPIIVTVSTVYAGIVSVKNASVKYEQQKTETDFKNNISYDYTQDMDYQDKIYHKIINSYEDYEESKKKWNNLILMTKQDFEESAVLVIAIENTSLIGLSISNITNDENTLYVELYQSDKDININETVMSAKISKSQMRDDIKFKITGEQPHSDNFMAITEIPKNYSKEQAVKDGCFVVEDKEVLSADKNELRNFAQNKTEGFIRIAEFGYKNEVADIEYKNETYYINILDLSTGKITYKIAKELIVMRPKELDYYFVISRDAYNMEYYNCAIKY